RHGPFGSGPGLQPCLFVLIWQERQAPVLRFIAVCVSPSVGLGLLFGDVRSTCSSFRLNCDENWPETLSLSLLLVSVKGKEVVLLVLLVMLRSIAVAVGISCHCTVG